MPLFRSKPGPAPALPAEKEIIVVGTEHHTDLRQVTPGPVGPVTVEPEKDAVLVRWAGRPVGYLSQARAKTYRPILSGVHPVEAHVKKAAVNSPELALFVMLPKVRT